MMLPITVIITTKNEERNIARCLEALSDFDEIIVVDSYSEDKTAEIALSYNVRVELFKWNGQYPKKRQWCLDNLKIKHDFVFFVDADEVVTDALIKELQTLDLNASGYFVRGQYVLNGKVLKHGLQNNKLCLINRHKIEFPVVDDLEIPGMGEIEGHYQPVLKSKYIDEQIRQVHTPLLHYAYDNQDAWHARHERYARWQVEVERRDALPSGNILLRRLLKSVFRLIPFRAHAAFIHSYILKLGFFDGYAGFAFARSRYLYYRMIEEYRQTVYKRRYE